MTVSQALEGRFLSTPGGGGLRLRGGLHPLPGGEEEPGAQPHPGHGGQPAPADGRSAGPEGTGEGELLLRNLLAIDATERLLAGETDPAAARCLEELLPRSYALQARLIQLFLVLRHRTILGVEWEELSEDMERLDAALAAL
mgnify:CR=1 FL=1